GETGICKWIEYDISGTWKPFGGDLTRSAENVTVSGTTTGPLVESTSAQDNELIELD
ncbi:unnamed protein product, partial [Didymodactylos carnosus]